MHTLTDAPVTPRFDRRRTEPLVRLTHGRRSARIEARWVATLGRAAAFELLVDLCRDRVLAGPRELVMEAREIPLKLLATLARADGAVVTAAQLYLETWRIAYAPERHANPLHAHVSALRARLRQVFGAREVIERVGGGYRLALRGAVVEPLPIRPGRRATVMALLAHARMRGFLDRRSVGRLAGLSRTRAHALLVQLARQGWLRREGSGRGTRYRVA